MADPALITEWLPATQFDGTNWLPAYEPVSGLPLARLRSPTGLCGACFNFLAPMTIDGVSYPARGECDHDAPVVFCVTLKNVADGAIKYNTCYWIPTEGPYRIDKYASVNQTYFVSSPLPFVSLYECSWIGANIASDPKVIMYPRPLLHDDGAGAMEGWHCSTAAGWTVPPPTSVLPASSSAVDDFTPFAVTVGLGRQLDTGKIVLTVAAGYFGRMPNLSATTGPQVFFGQKILEGPGCLKDAPYIVQNALSIDTVGPWPGVTPPSGFQAFPYPGTKPITYDVDGLVTEKPGVFGGFGGFAVVRPLLAAPLDSCNTYRVYQCATFWMYQWDCFNNSTVAGVVKYMPAECAEAVAQGWTRFPHDDDSTGKRIISYLAVTVSGSCDGSGAACPDTDTAPAAPTSVTGCPTCPTGGGCEAYKLHFLVNGSLVDNDVARDGEGSTTFVGTAAIVDCLNGSQRITLTLPGGVAVWLKVSDGGYDFTASKWVKQSDTIPGGATFLGADCINCPADLPDFCNRVGIVYYVLGNQHRAIFTRSAATFASSDPNAALVCEGGIWYVDILHDGTTYRFKALPDPAGGPPFSTDGGSFTPLFEGFDVTLGEITCWDCPSCCTNIRAVGRVSGVPYNYVLVRGDDCVYRHAATGSTITLYGHRLKAVIKVGKDVGGTIVEKTGTFEADMAEDVGYCPENHQAFTTITPETDDPGDTTYIDDIVCDDGEFVCLHTWVAGCDESGNKTVTLVDSQCRRRSELLSPLNQWNLEGGWVYYRTGADCANGDDDAPCTTADAGADPDPPTDDQLFCDPPEG